VDRAASRTERRADAERARRRSFLRAQARGAVRVVAVVALLVVYVTQPVFCRRGSDAVDAAVVARLRRDVAHLSSGLGPRDFAHPESLDQVAAFLRRELEQAGGRVEEQPFDAKGRTYRNVVASFGPEPGARVVVGAHYDTADPLPGADDNASGVAGLLELGRMLGTTPLATRVDLVAFPLEEPPFFRTAEMGSAVHARRLRDEGVAVRAMVCLEMIGFFSDAADSQHFPAPLVGLLYPSVGNFVAVVGNVGGGLLVRAVKSSLTAATDLPVRSLNAPSFVMGVDLSDHLNYWKAGFPAVMVTDTAFCRNRNYHTERDTADRLDYVRMAKVVLGVHRAVQDLAR
jgi:hypothetical protein